MLEDLMKKFNTLNKMIDINPANNSDENLLISTFVVWPIIDILTKTIKVTINA